MIFAHSAAAGAGMQSVLSSHNTNFLFKLENYNTLLFQNNMQGFTCIACMSVKRLCKIIIQCNAWEYNYVDDVLYIQCHNNIIIVN